MIDLQAAETTLRVEMPGPNHASGVQHLKSMVEALSALAPEDIDTLTPNEQLRLSKHLRYAAARAETGFNKAIYGYTSAMSAAGGSVEAAPVIANPDELTPVVQ